jgi:hypothetical protein
LFVQCGTEWDGFQCRAIVGPVSSNPQDVTGFADWSTSDPSIATVDTVGWVTIRGSGTIAIRAMFRGQLAFETLPVAPREVPIQIRTFWGSITDAQSHAPLSGVTVQILDGPNAGRIAVTGPDGRTRSTILSEAVEDQKLSANPALRPSRLRRRLRDPNEPPKQIIDAFTREEVERLSRSLRLGRVRLRPTLVTQNVFVLDRSFLA